MASRKDRKKLDKTPTDVVLIKPWTKEGITHPVDTQLTVPKYRAEWLMDPVREIARKSKAADKSKGAASENGGDN